MNGSPKSNRLHIAILGRTNVGKSSLLNYIVGQDVAITSPQAGTTTDVVEKTMELLPLGPVLFMDTAGLDDTSRLAPLRLDKTEAVFARADAVLLVLEAGAWTDYEEGVLRRSRSGSIPLVAVINKADLSLPSNGFIEMVSEKTGMPILASCLDASGRESFLEAVKARLFDMTAAASMEPPIIGDLVSRGSMAVLVVPIDLGAPKGRIILPQVQTIRDLLDSNATAVVVKEGELSPFLETIRCDPGIVVCDSQVIRRVHEEVPRHVPLTTFSILFARHKGNLASLARGARAIQGLRPGNRVLVAEACSHHPGTDDIGRVKLPAWLKDYCGFNVDIDVVAGKDYPRNLKDYDLIIHCGGCMLTRRHMLERIRTAERMDIPITNYGVAISLFHGVLERVLSPFPEIAGGRNKETAEEAARESLP